MIRSRLLSSSLRATRPSVIRATPSLARFAHQQETFEQFTERYVQFFESAEDLFEVQRGLNNCFAHDLVPAPSIIEAALRAARRVNDYATAVRIFAGVREKVENQSQYKSYLEELKVVREELGAFASVNNMPYILTYK
jgi:cytochrome c oxidase subunit 5a